MPAPQPERVSHVGESDHEPSLCGIAADLDGYPVHAFHAAEEHGKISHGKHRKAQNKNGIVANLDRFVEAQAGIYDQALAEIRAGRKRSHWMWYVFPQLAGLGNSPTSVRYGIANRDEAAAFLAHPILGPRLLQCAEAVLQIDGRSAFEIFGSPDDLKLRSCATLFAVVSPDASVFHRIIDKYFDGQRDPRTIELPTR